MLFVLIKSARHSVQFPINHAFWGLREDVTDLDPGQRFVKVDAVATTAWILCNEGQNSEDIFWQSCTCCDKTRTIQASLSDVFSHDASLTDFKNDWCPGTAGTFQCKTFDTTNLIIPFVFTLTLSGRVKGFVHEFQEVVVKLLTFYCYSIEPSFRHSDTNRVGSPAVFQNWSTQRHSSLSLIHIWRCRRAT